MYIRYENVKNMKSKHPAGSMAWLARAYGAKQVELLQLLGASRQYVHGVERGHFLPSVSYEAKLTHFQEVVYRQLASPKKKSSTLKASVRDRKPPSQEKS